MEAQLSEATFGERLMEARRIKGETIEEVSSQLRIRPSIILAMETSNFSHMPHKGYTRNMISSYARYLGLDSTRITEQFLKEFRRWESGSRLGSSNANSFSLASKRNAEPEEMVHDRERLADGRELITAGRRNTYRSTVFGSDTTRETDKKFRQQLRQNQDDQDTQHRSTARRAPSRRTVSDNPPSSSHRLRPNDYVGKPPRQSLFTGVSKNLASRPLVLVVGLVVVFVVILILWALLASNCASSDAAHVPVTGIAGEDTGLDEDQTSSNAADIQEQIQEANRYGPFELVVEVVGGPSWVQIDIDGSTPHAETFESGWRGSFTVNNEAKIVSGVPGNVRVYRNGIEVPLELADGLGQLELKVEQRPIIQNAQTAGEGDES